MEQEGWSRDQRGFQRAWREIGRNGFSCFYLLFYLFFFQKRGEMKMTIFVWLRLKTYLRLFNISLLLFSTTLFRFLTVPTRFARRG